MTYLLHSAVSIDISLLKSEINVKMRIRKDRSNSGLVTAGEIRDIENNPSLVENSYMFMKNIRGTVAYFKNQLYNLLAMFKALGPPTLFMTLSADDMHWKELGSLLNGLDDGDLQNSSISSVIPDRSTDSEMHDLVKKLQTHSHTPYCSNNYKSKCRFGFPKQQSTETKIFANIDLSKRKKGKFYVTRRGEQDIMINSYNPVVLRHWRANMDIQVISNGEGAAYYVCSYICKSEPDELKNALGHLIHGIFDSNPSIPRHVRLLKIGLTVLRLRRMSSQEAAYRLSNLNLIHTSRRFMYLNTRQPYKRFKILRSRKEIDELPDNCTNVFETNIHDYYQHRPNNLNIFLSLNRLKIL